MRKKLNPPPKGRGGQAYSQTLPKPKFQTRGGVGSLAHQVISLTVEKKMKAGDKVKEECPQGKTRPQGQGSAEDSDKDRKDTVCSSTACRAMELLNII